MEERELISRVLAGDPSAERALYDAHVDRVFRLAYRMAGDMDRAQDYTQETFIRAFSRLQTFRGDASLSTWLG
ncbi:MAG: RNA polymerase sigma factor, partial [Gemmatimonadales bacterium]